MSYFTLNDIPGRLGSNVGRVGDPPRVFEESDPLLRDAGQPGRAHSSAQPREGPCHQPHRCQHY